MAEDFLKLSPDDKREAIGVDASNPGRPQHILEKDVMVVWTVDGLFKAPFGSHLVFKGGTSLSKGYGVIKRFSEDIDVTYDVRELIPELANQDPPIPASNSQAQKWRQAIDQKLPKWVAEVAMPALQKHADETGVKVTLQAQGEKLFVDYEESVEGYGYVPSRVTVEFGARSTGEPAEEKDITCDAAPIEGVVFPTAKPKLMLPKRTFWEKATAVHMFCNKDVKDDDHISRHWHDLVRLDDAGYADEAFADRALAKDVAAFKGKFYRGTDRQGNPIDYDAAVSGKLQLVPTNKGDLAKLNADYDKMAEAGFLLEDIEPFDNLMDRCRDLEKRANAV